jgi:uncharacterized protein (DUF433 family)
MNDLDCNRVKVRPAKLIEDYHNGETQTEIASKYGLSVYMVRKLLLERGIDLEHVSHRKTNFE